MVKNRSELKKNPEQISHHKNSDTNKNKCMFKYLSLYTCMCAMDCTLQTDTKLQTKHETGCFLNPLTDSEPCN